MLLTDGAGCLAQGKGASSERKAVDGARPPPKRREAPSVRFEGDPTAAAAPRIDVKRRPLKRRAFRAGRPTAHAVSRGLHVKRRSGGSDVRFKST